MRAALLLFSSLLALAACDDKPSGGDTAGDGGSDSTPGDGGSGDGGAADGGSGDGGSGDGGASPDAPVITDGDAWCYQHTTGDKRWIWVATATATDPQGLDTIQSFATDAVRVFQGDTEIASYAITCLKGECTTTFDEADGVSCAQASSYTVVIRVVDEDDNWSEPYEVTGRQGTDASG